MVELVEKIFGALPSEVKNNLCFIELKKQERCFILLAFYYNLTAMQLR